LYNISNNFSLIGTRICWRWKTINK